MSVAQLVHDQRQEIAALRARITELTQSDPSWYDMSVANAFRLWKADREELERVKEARDACVSARDENSRQWMATDRMLKEAEADLSRCRADALEEAAREVDDHIARGLSVDGDDVRALQVTPPLPVLRRRDGSGSKDHRDIHLDRQRSASDKNGAADIRSAAKDTTTPATNSTVGEAG